MEEIKFFESAFFPPEFGELICIVFKACGVFLLVWLFCVLFGAFVLLVLVGFVGLLLQGGGRVLSLF